MKRRITFFLASMLALVFTISVNAQKITGSGPVVTEKITMNDISNIGLGISANVYLTQGNSQSIEVKGQKNIIDALEKKADGDTWDISFPNNTNVSMSEKLEIHITLKTVESLNIGGSGSIIGKSKFNNLEDVKINIGGSGSVDLALDGEEVDCNIGGSGSIKLKGAAEELNANIGGSGSVKAIDLQVEDAKVNTAGSGSVHIHVRDKLHATIVGSGGVKYKGNPKIEKNIMGSGRVKAY